MAYDKTKVVSDINELDSETKKGCLLFIEERKKRNLDIRIFETYDLKSDKIIFTNKVELEVVLRLLGLNQVIIQLEELSM